jgi:hypothetical protein
MAARSSPPTFAKPRRGQGFDRRAEVLARRPRQAARPLVDLLFRLVLCTVLGAGAGRSQCEETMSAVLQFTHSLETTTCPDCGMQFAVGPHWLNQRRGDKQTFYCPNGHTQSFRESEADRLRKQLELSARELVAKESALQTQRTRAADAECERDRAEKKLARVKNGVCPCCKRSFVALQRHMKTKHPGFAARTR